MASLTLKNVPDDLLNLLREVAREDRRSMSQEIVHLLDIVLNERKPGSSTRARDAARQVAAWRALAGKWVSDTDERTEARRIMKRRTRGRKVTM